MLFPKELVLSAVLLFLNCSLPSTAAHRESSNLSEHVHAEHLLEQHPAAERSLAGSDRADPTCPDPTLIEPCVCTVGSLNNVSLDCTLVESKDQLAAVFQQDFPVKELYKFSMANNTAVEILGNILNDVTIQRLELYPGPFALEHISEYFLIGSKDVLSDIRIRDSALASNNFPFAVLSTFEALESLEVVRSNLTWLPNITGSGLRVVRLIFGQTEEIETATFSIHTKSMAVDINSNQIHTVKTGSFVFADDESQSSTEEIYIDISGNKLESVEAGTFPFRYGPTTVLLANNQITSVNPGAFVLPEGDFSTYADTHIDLSSNKLKTLQAGTFPIRNGESWLLFDDNEIASVESGSFVMPDTTDHLKLHLHMSTNQMTAFDEDVFGDIMPYVTELKLEGNPLTCGCDMEWLITNEDHMATVDLEASCEDGTKLHDITAVTFSDCSGGNTATVPTSTMSLLGTLLIVSLIISLSNALHGLK